MIHLGKHSVLGIDVNAIDYEAAVDQIVRAGTNRQSMTVTALAVHGVMTGFSDPTHHYRLNHFDLVCPDGQPVRWALRLLHGCKLKDRVYGPELTLRICEAAASQQISIFLFGATEQTLDGFASNLCKLYPNLTIAGRRASQFRTLRDAERDALAQEIRDSGAGVCFVGLGCPRQEIFAYEMRDRINLPLVAVGAAFAFHAGTLEQAPPWMQKRGLEWLFRLSREPGRLWQRYLMTNPAFLFFLSLQKLGLYRDRTDGGTKPTHDIQFG